MPVPTFKPWIDGRGQPVCVPDPNGDFVHLADYQALEQRFYASNKAIHALETKEYAPAEDANGDDKS